MCQLVKAKHQRPVGELQLLPILEWKWEDVSIDFVIELPMTSTRKKKIIWIIIDMLTKSAHFLPIANTDSMDYLSKIYVKETVWLHEVPKSILSNRDKRFTSYF